MGKIEIVSSQNIRDIIHFENMYSPLISIIVPIYNVEMYLSKCVDSICAQTYTNLEIILVDDGSPDNCGKMCDEYAAKDSRIKVIHKENGGLSDARNVAIDVAQGEYLTFVDSDDYISYSYVADLYNIIKQYQADISVNTYCAFRDGMLPRPKHCGGENFVFSGLQATEAMFYQRLFDTTAWGKMYKASLFENIRYPKGLLYEDLPTTYKLLLKADKVAYSNNESYYYRLRSNSIQWSIISPQKLNSALALIDIMEDDKDKFQPILKSYYCRLVSFIFHLYKQMPSNYEYKNLFQEKIKEYRCIVLFDKYARTKTRLACLLSYLGLDIISKMFALLKRY